MSTKKTKKNFDFIMDTDWLFNGILDAEQKQYVLLDYFQKLNKHLELMEVYPMFIELSLHLGNIQTLLNKNQILYTDKKFLTNDDELVLSDLKVKDIPVLADEEIDEYHQILKNTQPQLFYYFNFAKSIWSMVYDSVDIVVKKNKNNFKSNSGFFYFKSKNIVYVWQYTTKKVYRVKNQSKTTTKLVYEGPQNNLTMLEIISKFSKTYEKNEEVNNPVFEMFCKDIFPLEETLIPIFKRKVLTYISQSGGSKKTVKYIE
jgi:succinate dehydrogenase flavin-adding protein (antitoxin of CptAB toxin-antitoxin module)